MLFRSGRTRLLPSSLHAVCILRRPGRFLKIKDTYGNVSERGVYERVAFVGEGSTSRICIYPYAESKYVHNSIGYRRLNAANYKAFSILSYQN